jgi:hypothetical protein
MELTLLQIIGICLLFIFIISIITTCIFFVCIEYNTNRMKKNLKIGDWISFYINQERVCGKITKIKGKKITATFVKTEYIKHIDAIYL